jgi:glucose-1-phosphate adenylyltransferase
VGSIDSYFETNMDLLRVPAPFSLADCRWAPDSTFHEWVPAICATSAIIGRRAVRGRNILSGGVAIGDSQVVNCVLSPRVRIGDGCEVEECILFEGADVGDGCRLRRTIVEEGVRIPSGTTIGYGDDANDFTLSPGGVAVISGSYRFHVKPDDGASADTVSEDTVSVKAVSPDAPFEETEFGETASRRERASRGHGTSRRRSRLATRST